ncbi:MAG: OmpA family protein [Pseudomonadota bacterium]
MRETAPRPPRRLFLASALAALTAGGVAALVALGAVDQPRTETFQFARGTSFANGEEARLRALLAEAATDARIAVTVIGHSGTQGDNAANVALSEARAVLVAEMADAMGIDDTRLNATGIGGASPLPKPDGTSDRAFEASLARVDVTLQVRR